MFPLTVGNNEFRIDSSTYTSTASNPNARPTNNAGGNYIYGQADVKFTSN